MRAAPAKSLAVAVVCLGALGALRCNAVLGIESAELDPTFGTGGSSGTAGTSGTSGTSGTGGTSMSRGIINVPYPTCARPSTDCSTCIATCQGFNMTACLASKNCRETLEAYRACLGPSCNGGGVDCVEQTLAGTFEPLLDALATCLSQTCAEGCAGSPLVPMCELYCACMKDNCTSKSIATDPDCVQVCESDPATNDETIAHCRKHHCEYIDVDPFPGHCDHAIGVDQCVDPVDPDQDCPNDGILSGFPCTVGDVPCCNGICGAGHTCQ